MDAPLRGRYQHDMTVEIASDPTISPSHRAVGWWLIIVAALIAAMLIIGGLTRLTGSGLSITEWRPVTGIVPPSTDPGWQQEFAKYQRIPQYRLENRGMTLGQFKSIYWWEWTHRLLGRLIGVVFLLPFLFFAWTGAIGRKAIPRMLTLFALGGLQGFVGWWMVQSGLETRVSVSQYRLAIHLGTALLLFAAVLWIALEYLHPAFVRGAPRPRYRGLVFAALVYLQMLLGALVAGLHAGLIYNTWPSMNGRPLPEHPFFAAPWWSNFFENPGLAQFDHRLGAYAVAASALALWWIAARENLKGSARASAYAILFVTTIQIVLGIENLLSQVPLVLSALHQVTALALFAVAVWHAFELRRFTSNYTTRTGSSVKKRLHDA
jgi:cytochrome c oxidase assembly protein subunit 15